MHQRNAHPSTNPETSGKARRYVTHTTAFRSVRLDERSDEALLALKRTLSQASDAREVPSISLVVRRALRLYHQLIVGQQLNIADEQRRVRECSRLPGP